MSPRLRTLACLVPLHGVGSLGIASGAAAEPDAAMGPVLVPADAPRRRDPALPALAPVATVVYVNFDGAELSAGWDDAAAQTTQIDEMVGTFAPFGDDASRRAAIMQALREDWAGYDVQFTDERPVDGPYTMAMVGPTNPFGPATLGIASLDCGDSQTPANIAFAFYHAGDGRSALMTATTIGHEVAHTFGLEHIDEPTAVMNSFNVGGDPWFHDECLPVVGDVACGPQHTWTCGVPGEQNAHDELLALFGPAVPDATPPDVAIVTPSDRTILAEGARLRIEVEADDAQGIAQIRLWENGRLSAFDDGRPYGWEVVAPEVGDHAFVVEAFDRAGNRARSREVVVTVQAHDDDRPHDVAGRGAEPRRAPKDDADDARERTGWRQPGADVSLRCSTAPDRTGAGWALLGLLAGALRKRRSLLRVL